MSGDELAESGGGSWFQSKRKHIYRKYEEDLLATGKAYRCFCDETRLSLLRRNATKQGEKIGYDGKCRHLTESKERQYLAEGRPYVIRFKLEDQQVDFNDLTNGLHSSNPWKQEGDFVLVKSDRMPTYHFANVVDDHVMRITHVFRGQEWQLSTAKHILLYEAFGWKAPRFAHLPLICNPDGSKISKRQGDIDVLSYKRRGYLPQTLLAYLSTIGGGFEQPELDKLVNTSGGEELLRTLTYQFDVSTMNTRSIKMNPELLDNLNRKFLQKDVCNPHARVERLDDLRSLLADANISINDNDYLNLVLLWAQARVNRLNELVEDTAYAFLWSDFSNFSSSVSSEDFVNNSSLDLIDELTTYLNASDDASFDNIDGEITTSALKKELNKVFKKLAKTQKSTEPTMPKPTKPKYNSWQ